MNLSWTEERVDLLKRLWGEGLSASQCALHLGGGLTRNAVVGKVHRLKLIQGDKNGQPISVVPRVIKKRRLRRQIEPANTRSVPAQRPALANDLDFDHPVSSTQEPRGDQGCQLEDLTDATCKWPIGDPGHPDFHFCGGSAQRGIPYCGHHARIAYQPASERRQALKDKRAERDAVGKLLAAEMRHS